MLDPETFAALMNLQSQGIRQIPLPNYDIRATQILWHLRRTVGFDEWVWNAAYAPYHGHEYHLVNDLITWQEDVYVDNLISLNNLTDNDLMLNILHGLDAPHVVVYGDYKIMVDGNHRWWHLLNRGISEAIFKTVYFQDIGDLNWDVIPIPDWLENGQ